MFEFPADFEPFLKTFFMFLILFLILVFRAENSR